MQIQFNYVDYDDPAVESRKCYEVCRKFHKPVIAMEPVKGGNLVNLSEPAMEVFQELGDASLDLCQYFRQKKLKDYAAFLSSSCSFCCGVR